VVVDICAYRSPAMMDCMFVKRLQTAQSDPDYAALFHGRPRRFVLPLKPRSGAENQVGFIAAYNSPTPTTLPSSMAALAALSCR
jgi:carotenoid isomerooxygenase